LALKGPNAAGRLIAPADRIELQPIDLAARSRVSVRVIEAP
jgi:hypothetical protein